MGVEKLQVDETTYAVAEIQIPPSPGRFFVEILLYGIYELKMLC